MLFHSSRSSIGAVAAEQSVINSGLSLPDWLTALEIVRRVKPGHSNDSMSERRSELRQSSFSHRCHSTGSRMTGIRWWMDAIRELDSVMMIAAAGSLRSLSPIMQVKATDLRNGGHVEFRRICHQPRVVGRARGKRLMRPS